MPKRRHHVDSRTPTPSSASEKHGWPVYHRRRVETLRRRLRPALAVLRLRNLAMEFCDEFVETASSKEPRLQDTLLDISRMFMPRVGQAGFRLDTFKDLMSYFTRCINRNVYPQPRDIVFTLLPWARKGPCLRPDLWDHHCTQV